MICTPPMRHRSCCCGLLPGSWAMPGSWCWVPTATLSWTAATRWPSRWRSFPGNLRPGTCRCPAWMRPAWPASSGRSPGSCRGRAWRRPCTATPRGTRCSWGRWPGCWPPRAAWSGPVTRRGARLPEPCGRVLGLASVFGREFWLPALERLCGVGAGELLDSLEEAIAAGLVAAVPGAPGRLRFSHALIRDTLYEVIPAGQRLRLHQQAGEALEAFYQPDPDPHLAELARHFFEAAAGGGAGKAVGYAERGGRRALTLLAYEEAARLFRMALAALGLARPPGEDQARCRLLLALGDALTMMGERQAAREELRLAAGLARRYQMAEELGRAALAYAGFGWERGATDRQMIPLRQDARAMLAGEEGAGPVRARVLAALAVALRDQPDRGPRDAL